MHVHQIRANVIVLKTIGHLEDKQKSINKPTLTAHECLSIHTVYVAGEN